VEQVSRRPLCSPDSDQWQTDNVACSLAQSWTTLVNKGERVCNIWSDELATYHHMTSDKSCMVQQCSVSVEIGGTIEWVTQLTKYEGWETVSACFETCGISLVAASSSSMWWQLCLFVTLLSELSSLYSSMLSFTFTEVSVTYRSVKCMFNKFIMILMNTGSALFILAPFMKYGDVYMPMKADKTVLKESEWTQDRLPQLLLWKDNLTKKLFKWQQK